jgi:acyl CoA:acetate/3-ketoacid CoA transferase beta subunit
MGAIGAAQVDRHGNVNSTRMNGMHIVGSGGANDIASAALETIVVAQQRKGQFVDKVEYVTSPGRRVRCVVASQALYEKLDGDELVLTGWFGAEASGAESAIRDIKELCGWDLKVSDSIVRLGDPTPEETALLRIYDPERLFLGKSKKKEPVGAGAV